MFMNAEIELSANNTPALPSEAIVRFENKDYVFVAQTANQFEMLEVKTGSTENSFTELIAPENLHNKNIVVKGAYHLLMAIKNKEEE